MSYVKYFEEREKILAGYQKIESLENVSDGSRINLEGICEITKSGNKWLGLFSQSGGVVRVSNGEELPFAYRLHHFHLDSLKFAENLHGYLVLASCAQEGRSISLYGKLNTNSTKHHLIVKHVEFEGRLAELRLNGRSLKEVWNDMFA